MNTIVVARRERPVSPPVKASLVCVLALLTLLYFPICLLALLIIGSVLILDGALMVILLRVAGPAAAIPPMRRLWRLGRVVLSTIRSPREGAKYHIELTEMEAPQLFATVAECARRIGCAMPDSIVLEMTCSAWVRLEGFRSGRGRSTLGLGFMLLCGLSRQEIEAIILHEMGHALLVQRGAKRFGMEGVSRFVRLAEETGELMGREQPADGEIWKGFWTAHLLRRMAGFLALSGVRLYALYSRQDEFDADRSSAALCGGSLFGDALVKSAMLDAKSGEIAWHDCVIQSQRDGSYTEWLRGKLRFHDEKEMAKLRREAIDADRRSGFRVHPTMEDRIAHVSEDSGAGPLTLSFGQAAPCPWFADSDATVERLFVLIEGKLMEEEREESESLSRWERTRKVQRAMNALEVFGAVLIMLGGVGIPVGLFVELGLDGMQRLLMLAGCAGAIVVGAALYRLARPPEPDMLPAPDFVLFEDSLEKIWATGGRFGSMLPAPAIVAVGPAASAGRAERLQYWTERGHSLLQRCDYPAALSCGLEALAAVKTNLEGMLLAGVAYNCLGDEAAGDRLLSQVIEFYPRSAAVRWAMAWVCLATGNWRPAEAYLLGVVDQHPRTVTFVAALALAQARHGNLRQATENMRRALALEPQSMRLRLRLVQYLLMAGRAREAAPEIEAVERFPNAQTDREVQLSLVRMHLMLNHKELADAQARTTALQHPEPQTFFRLGTSYAMTDHFEEAQRHFHHATANALYPLAWVQLGFLHEKEGRREEARACFLGALNLFHPVAPKAEDPFDALDAALAGLRGLRAPSPTLFLWEIILDVRQLPAFKMAEFMLLILAPNRAAALGFANELFVAMHPGGPPLDAVLRRSEKADIEPPDGATEAGIVDWRGRR